ncbi:MAG: DUF1638 domain-containing protein [Oscillospiraceae bacterium]|jgi:hypothetical protein|nr:DUF1638 domain-containing protein [Oscillospiraceae bacterium]
MRIALIACRVFSRELNYYASQSPHAVELTWLPQGLHTYPDRLRQTVQSTIVELERQYAAKESHFEADVIALGYGLCSNGVIGLKAGKLPLVVPRTDDCIAVFLGSQERYLNLFNQMRGCYWLNNGWIEYGWLEEGHVPSSEMLTQRRNEYAEKYGEDNADFLIETEMSWIGNYHTCAYIESTVYDCPKYRETARRFADENKWERQTVSGDHRMLRMLTDGTWNDEEFLVVPPGYRIAPLYDGRKMAAEQARPAEKQ